MAVWCFDPWSQQAHSSTNTNMICWDCAWRISLFLLLCFSYFYLSVSISLSHSLYYSFLSFLAFNSQDIISFKPFQFSSISPPSTTHDGFLPKGVAEIPASQVLPRKILVGGSFPVPAAGEGSPGDSSKGLVLAASPSPNHSAFSHIYLLCYIFIHGRRKCAKPGSSRTFAGLLYVSRGLDSSSSC